MVVVAVAQKNATVRETLEEGAEVGGGITPRLVGRVWYGLGMAPHG